MLRPVKIPLLVALAVIVAQASTQGAQTSPKVASGVQAPESAELLLLKDAIVNEILTRTNENKTKSWDDPTVLVSACAVLITIASVSFSFFQFRRNRADTLVW